MAITLNGNTGITTDIDGDESLTLNRDTSDGDIITLQKDNTTVGSIGTNGSRTYIGSGSGQSGLKFNLNGIVAVNGADGSIADASYSLGVSSVRFTDAYLSGGVYVGGTGSANYLDDYEEGTWTPGFESSGGTSLTVSNNDGMYTKIGRFVMVTCRLSVTSSGSGISSGACVTGLPFTPFSGLSPATSYDFMGAGGLLTGTSAFSAGDQFFWAIDGGVSRISLMAGDQGNPSEIPTNTFTGDEGLRLTAYYFTS